MKRLRVILCGVLLFLGFSHGVNATLVTVDFQGNVEKVADSQNLLTGLVKDGDPFNVTITFDNQAGTIYYAHGGQHTQYFFDASPYGMNAVVGGLTFHTVYDHPYDVFYGDFLAQVSDNETFVSPILGSDNLFFISYGTATDAHTVAGLLFMTLILADPTGNALNEEILPGSAPQFSDWPNWEFSIRYYYDMSYVPLVYEVIGGNIIWESGGGGEIGAPVPEPATMLLVASGLAGLAAFRRRFRKN